jgi:uncharacterized protein YggE
VGPGIAVTGVGSATGRPDVVRAQLTATASRPRLADALAAAEEAAGRAREVLARFGLTGEDAATFGLSVVAEEVWREGQGSHITGFRADHTMAVTVRDVAAVGSVLGQVLVAGGDDVRLGGVEFAVEDEAALRARARELAWADALARAEQLAGLAGVALGPVSQIEERVAGYGGPRPMMAMRAMAPMQASADVGVEPGRVAVTVSLDVGWALA